MMIICGQTNDPRNRIEMREWMMTEIQETLMLHKAVMLPMLPNVEQTNAQTKIFADRRKGLANKEEHLRLCLVITQWLQSKKPCV